MLKPIVFKWVYFVLAINVSIVFIIVLTVLIAILIGKLKLFRINLRK
jgi:hypothetical protein